MPIHIGDYKRDTGHLRAAEHGAYLLLLFHHWATGSLPDDDRQLSAIACMSLQEWKRTKPILAPFFQAGWVHGRVVVDLQKAQEKYEKLAGAGKRGGEAKARASKNPSQASQTLEKNSGDALPTDYRLPIKEDSRGDAGARASSFTVGSKALTHAFWKALAIDSPLQIPPELAGTDWRALEWERAGWTESMIAAEVRRVGPGKPLSYYEKCFATAHAKLQAPLPTVEIKPSEKITVTHGTNQSRSTGSLLSSIRRQLAEVEKERADLEMSGSAVLSIPDRSIR